MNIYTLDKGADGVLIAIADSEEKARVFMSANIPGLYERIKDGDMTEEPVEEGLIYYSYGEK